ncbi:MAG: hemin transporter HemP [Gammaproteobacteria bacterium]|nr:hemin transporter HemP [Gammaproteobacteria bacterium]
MTVGDIQKSVKSLDSKSLFKGQSCIFIEHNGELYSLRITSNDKLILTK